MKFGTTVRCLMAVASLLWQSAGTAQAQLFFGESDYFYPIQPTTDPELILSHKVTIYYFGAGVGFSDDGYVLQKVGVPNKYGLLSSMEIKEFQQTGLLPSPLPKYTIPLTTYLFGYGLWIILGFLVCFISLTWWAGRRRDAARVKAIREKRANQLAETSAVVPDEAPEDGNPFAGLHEAYMDDLPERMAESARQEAADIAGAGLGVGIGIGIISDATGVPLPQPGEARSRRSKKDKPKRRIFGLETDLPVYVVLLIVGGALASLWLVFYLSSRR